MKNLDSKNTVLKSISVKFLATKKYIKILQFVAKLFA